MNTPSVVSTAGGALGTVMNAPPVVSTAGGALGTVINAPSVVSTAGGALGTVMNAPSVVSTAGGTLGTVMNAPPVVSTAGGALGTVMNAPPVVSTAGVALGTVMNAPPVVSTAGVALGTVMNAPPVVSAAGGALGTVMNAPPVVSTAGVALGTVMNAPSVVSTAGGALGTVMNAPPVVSTAGVALGTVMNAPPVVSTAGGALGTVMNAPPVVSTAGVALGTVMNTPPVVSTAGGALGTVMNAPPLVSTAGGTLGTVMNAPPVVSTAGGALGTVMNAPPVVSTAGGALGTVMNAPPVVATAGGALGTVMNAPPVVSTAGGALGTMMNAPPVVSTAGGALGTVMNAPPVVSTAGGALGTVMNVPPVVSTAGGALGTVMNAPPVVSTAGGSLGTVMNAPPIVSTAGGALGTVMNAPPVVSTAGGALGTVMNAPPVVSTAGGAIGTVMNAPPVVSTAGGALGTVMNAPPVVSTACGALGTVMNAPPVVSTAGGALGTVMNASPVVSTAGVTYLAQAGVATLTKQDENVLKYFVMLRPTGPAGTSLAKVCRELYGGGQLSVKDYIRASGFNNKHYHYIFTAEERSALEAGTDWELLDLTFLYNLLRHVCGLAKHDDRKWKRPLPQERDSLEHILFSIKCERNFLFHEAVGLTDRDLDDRSQRLKSLLKKALEKASLITGNDCVHDVTEMKERIDDILQCRTKLSVQDYQSELQEFRQTLVKEVISDSRRELHRYYQMLWKADRVCWRANPDCRWVAVEDVFTSVTVLTRKDCEVPMADILDYQLPNASLPRLVILEGAAGAGKSQLCKYYLHCWATGNSTSVALKNVDIIILLQCHSLTSQSLREFVTEEILKDTCKGLRHEDVIPTLRECKTIFIIDGLDEAGNQAMLLVREVSAKFSESRVVVTCRPEFTEEAKRKLSSLSDDFIILNMKGFNKFQQREYAEKLLTLVESDASKRQERIQISSIILENLEHVLHYLVCLPLTLTMMIELWQQQSDFPTPPGTMNHILQKSVDLSVKLLVHRLQRKPEEHRSISVLEHACWEWLKCLATVANMSLSRDTLVLDKIWISDLMREAHRHKIDPSYALSSFLKHTSPEVASEAQETWQFFHKSYQEYLAAFHSSQDTKEEHSGIRMHKPRSMGASVAWTKSTENHAHCIYVTGAGLGGAAARRDHYMLQFLAALEFSKPKIDVVRRRRLVRKFKESIMGYRWISWSNLIRECGENQELCAMVKPYLEQETVSLNGSIDKISQTLRAVQYLMQVTRFTPVSLFICLGDDDIFPDVLASLLRSLGKISVHTDLKCSPIHCLDLRHCLSQQETLQYVTITIYENKFLELYSLTQLLQCLNGTDCKLKMEITVHDLQNMVNFAQYFAGATIPRQTDLSLYFKAVRRAMLEPLRQVFQAFPWHASLSVACSHTDLGDQAVHLPELVTQALTDARVKVASAYLEMGDDAMASGDHYMKLFGIVASDLPLEVSSHRKGDGDDVRLVMRGRKDNVEQYC